MKIEQLKINGVERFVGYAFEELIASFKVTETESKKAASVAVKVTEEGKTVFETAGPEVSAHEVKLDFVPEPMTEYQVTVAVTGDAGDSAEASCVLETGKMGTPVRGEWIAAKKEDTFHPEIVKEIEIAKPVKKARLYVTGVGLFEAYLNGEKIGDEFLTPYVTNYECGIQLITLEPEVVQGKNTFSFLLGKGWYMSVFGLGHTADNYGDRMALLAELVITYADGTEELVGTDSSWLYRQSQIVESGIYFGETLDRTLVPGPLAPVEIIADPAADPGTKNLVRENLRDRLSIPVVVKEEVPVAEIITTPAGETVLDLGQNFAGYLAFRDTAPAGTALKIEFGEILQGGNFYHGNYRDAESEFNVTAAGDGAWVRPHFTFFGFRYAKVTGFADVKKEDFCGKVVYSDLTRTGYIETSDPRINRLYANGVWGMKSNFIDMPTDCPQRDERLGWTGDAQVFSPTASYHMDTRAFFLKFVVDLMDEQKFLNGAVPNYVPNIGHAPDATSIWGDIATFLPMTVYQTFGETGALKKSYPMMKGWVDFCERSDKDKRYCFNLGFQFGDWLGLDGPSEDSFKGGTDDNYLGSVYYYRSAKYVAEAAGILGLEDDVKYYGDLAEKIKAAILFEYFTPSGRFAMDTQASYVVALKFGLYVDKDRLVAQFRDRLKKDGYRIRCGFVGAPLLCTVLAEVGLTELAYDFLLQEGFPSWLYAVSMGATTIWERWNSVMEDGSMSPTGMNSLNHYSYGSVMEFVYKYAAGIRPLTPGFKKAIIEPRPDARLPKLCASYDSVSGRYVSAIDVHKDGTVSFHVEIPFDCEADVILPAEKGKAQEIRTLGAGTYDFTYVTEKDYQHPYSESTTLARLAKDPRAMAILGRLTPPLAGIAASGNKEFLYSSLGELGYTAFFMGFPPENLGQAIAEISQLSDEA